MKTLLLLYSTAYIIFDIYGIARAIKQIINKPKIRTKDIKKRLSWAFDTFYISSILIFIWAIIFGLYTLHNELNFIIILDILLISLLYAMVIAVFFLVVYLTADPNKKYELPDDAFDFLNNK